MENKKKQATEENFSPLKDNECKSEKKYCDITHKSTTPSDMSLEFQ